MGTVLVQAPTGVLAGSRLVELLDVVEPLLRERIGQHDHSACAGYSDCKCARDEGFATVERAHKAELETHLETLRAQRAHAARPRRRQRIDLID